MTEPTQPAAPSNIIVHEVNKQDVLGTLKLVMLGMLLCLTTLRVFAPPSAVRYVEEKVGTLLSQPIAAMTQWEVDCTTTAGGVSLLTDTGGVTHVSSTLMVLNGSSTCVQIGGAGITSTTGAAIGTGATCIAGTWLSADAKGGRCISTSGTVTVDVLGGSP